MKYWITIFLYFVFVILGSSHGWTKQKNARNKLGESWNFCYTVQCATGRDCSDYKGYGCWCGWGGVGAPVDAIDRCCQEHAHCYRLVNIRQHCSLGKYDDYRFECIELGPVKKPLCSIQKFRCQELMCECDVEAAECFASYPYPDKKPECPENTYKTLSLKLGRNKNYYGPSKHNNLIF